MDDPTGQWPKWIGKAIAVVAVAAVVVAAVAVTVSTFGAGSVAGVAAISAAVTIAARATEVAVLQVKKSKNTSKNTGGKISGNTAAYYEYDPYSNITKASGSHATINPLRYRGYYYDTETGLYYISSRYYDPEIGRFISPDTTAVLTATPMGLTDKNLYAYCDNNPIVRVDHGGQFWETAFDVISLGASIVAVCADPTDPWAWVGLAFDVVDVAVPFVGGLGDVTRAVGAAMEVADGVIDAGKTVEKIDGVVDSGKTIKNARASAVKKAWNNELADVQNGGSGVSRLWTPDEQIELLTTGKVKGYHGHHMKSVKGYPGLAGDPFNIQFLTPNEHLDAHGGNRRKKTDGRYDY